MIFPDMPKRQNFWTPTQIVQINSWAEQRQVKVQAVEPEHIEHKVSSVSVEEWWQAHGLSAASTSGQRASGPINWFARDAWEFYTLFVFMIAWVAYWYQVSH